jgi:hypothetical protein
MEMPLPTSWLALLNITILEFLRVVMSIWTEYLEGHLTALSCILAMTNNTSPKQAGFANETSVNPETVPKNPN